MKQKTCQNQGVVLVTRTDFFTFFSFLETTGCSSCSRKLLRPHNNKCLQIHRSSSAGFQRRGSIRNSQVPQSNPHSLSRRHSISCKKVGIYFYFSLLLQVKSSFREKCPPINKVERQTCCSTQCHKITGDRLFTTR